MNGLTKIFAVSVIDEDTGESMEYRDLIKKYKYREVWNTSFVNELRRLAQVIRDVKGTITIFFIQKSEILKDRQKDVT